ncbi:hypothetical protein [Streptomyces sp. NPDC049881]|uniref:hypothetical protein n=1 Tax=Streptomyces sp. NPDC049881 TaxID=3155778 RepID=UPI003430A866
MTRHWADAVVNRELLDGYYSAVPPLSGAVLRSLYLDRNGPSVILRIDLPALPDRGGSEGAGAEAEWFGCHVAFLDVADVRITGRLVGGPVDVTLDAAPPEGHRRLAVTVTRQDEAGQGRFTANESLRVGHLAAHGDAPETYRFAGPVDRIRLRGGLPDTTDRAFYERV